MMLWFNCKTGFDVGGMGRLMDEGSLREERGVV